jgi:hypothetical protein
VPLLCGSSWNSVASAGSNRAFAAHAHTSLQHWTPVNPRASAATAPSATAPTAPAAAADRRSGSKSGGGAAAAAAVVAAAAAKASTLTSPHVTLPPHIFFVANNALCRYTLASKGVSTVVTLPYKVKGGGTRQVSDPCGSTSMMVV